MIDRELFNLIGKNKSYIYLAVGAMIIGLLGNLSITGAVCWVIYLLIQEAAGMEFVYPLMVACAGMAIRYGATRCTGNLKDKLGCKVKRDLRHRAYAKIVVLGEKGAGSMSIAGLTQVTMEGIEQLDLYYSNYLPQFFYAMISPILLFAICIKIDWHVATVLIACVPIIPISIVLVSKYAKKIFAKYWGKYTSMGDTFLDSVQGLKELKIFCADQRQHEYINKSAEEFRKITMKVLVMQLCSITIMDFVAFGGAGLGISFAIKGAISGQSPVLALFLILIAVEFFLPLRALGSAFHVAMNGASAGKKIITLLDMPEPVWSDEIVEKTEISIENVSFSYDGKRNAVNNVSAKFESKGLYAIVGESGCGKSTIVSLITGANRGKTGHVLIGEKEIETLSRENYFSHLAVVSYDTYIFNTSIRENFCNAKADVTDEEIFDALRLVNLFDYVTESGGLDKVILEDANNLSGGQRQRLALAINLVANKDIYIFDEATSNIDIESEAIIMENIIKLSKEKLVIVISHRLANVVDADKIFYLESGEIKERGSHKELMSFEGGYAKLYKTQKMLEEGYKEVIA